jgi:DNA-binding response OmpR family regulator
MIDLAPLTSLDELPELAEQGQVVLVERFRVAPSETTALAHAWARHLAPVRRRPGFVSARLRDGGEEGAFVGIVVWRSARALRDALGVDNAIRFGSVEIDRETREVRRDGERVGLTLKEYELLLTLASSPRRVFTRDELMDRVWGYRAALETGTLSVHVRRLRAKLEPDPAVPRHLQTVWGVGYRFVP